MYLLYTDCHLYLFLYREKCYRISKSNSLCAIETCTYHVIGSHMYFVYDFTRLCSIHFFDSGYLGKFTVLFQLKETNYVILIILNDKSRKIIVMLFKLAIKEICICDSSALTDYCRPWCITFGSIYNEKCVSVFFYFISLSDVFNFFIWTYRKITIMSDIYLIVKRVVFIYKYFTIIIFYDSSISGNRCSFKYFI